MLLSDTYLTISKTSSGEFRDKGSRFIGYAFPVKNEQEIKMLLHTLKQEHYSAAHHCHAFILGASQQVQKSHDDREPANSAGKPILRAILSRQLTDTLVIVVRYFGGRLLGVPGLINAYGAAAEAALNENPAVEKIVTERYRVEGLYENENELYKLYKALGAKLISHTYNENRFTGVFDIRKSKAAEIVKAIGEKRLFEVTFVSET